MNTLPEIFRANPRLHAYLYESGDYVQRRETARLIASSMLCRKPESNGEPCGICDCCIKTRAQTHPDCIIVGNGKNTTVKEVRAIEEEAYLAPNEADVKVFVLDDADEFNVYSQNALLKIIEEPPKGVKFVLTASSKAALLPTVRSRVCIISGNTKSLSDLQLEIKKIKPHIDEKTAYVTALFASYFDRTDIKELDGALVNEYIKDAVSFFSGEKKDAAISFPKKREELALCLQVYMLICREIAASKCTNKMTDGFMSQEELCACNAKTSMKKAHALYDIFEEASINVEENSNVNATLAYLSQKL